MKARMRQAIMIGWWGVRIYGDATGKQPKTLADYFDELLTADEREDKEALAFIARMDALAAANEP